jgi:hypothetical protein
MIHIGDSKTFHFQFLAIQAYFSMVVLLRYAFGRHKAVLSPCAPWCNADVPALLRMQIFLVQMP